MKDRSEREEGKFSIWRVEFYGLTDNDSSLFQETETNLE